MDAKNKLDGLARGDANSFVVGNNGYIACGDGIGLLSDLWEYNTIADTWSQKANFPSTARGDAAAFSICDKGYYGTGEVGFNSYAGKPCLSAAGNSYAYFDNSSVHV